MANANQIFQINMLRNRMMIRMSSEPRMIAPTMYKIVWAEVSCGRSMDSPATDGISPQ